MAVTDTTDTIPQLGVGVMMQQQAAAAVVKISSGQVNSDVEFATATCECCGLTEECTIEYIVNVKERNQGRWICGLCTEAVKDEIRRSAPEKLIANEEALDRHMNFCKEFKSSSPPSKPTEKLITAMKQLLLRSLDSPRTPGSSPASPPMRKTGSVYGRSQSVKIRSESCYSSMNG